MNNYDFTEAEELRRAREEREAWEIDKADARRKEAGITELQRCNNANRQA